MQNIANNLLAFRRYIGMTQDDIATLCNIGKRTYIGWERGETKITLNSLQPLVLKYSLNINWLLTGEGDMTTGAGSVTDPAIDYKARVNELEQENQQLKTDLEKMDDLIMRMGERMRDRLDRLKD